jgi:hypothetical protein
MTLSCLLLLAALAPADASAPVDGPPPPDAVRVEDAGAIQGLWEIVGCVFGGTDYTDLYRGGRWSFTGYTGRRIDSIRGPVEEMFLVLPDNYSDPIRMDLVDRPGNVRRGPISREGDSLRWVWIRPDGVVTVWTLKKVK